MRYGMEMRFLALLFLPLFLRTAAEPVTNRNVLFVGNSYTAPVAARFKEFSVRTGKTGRIEAITPGGVQLRVHVAKGEVAKRLSAAEWDVVSVQEQSQTPSFPEEQVREITDPALRELQALAGKAGATLVLYQHWPRRDGDKANRADDTMADQRVRLNATFSRLSREFGVPLIPVSDAWESCGREHPEIKLHAADGSHPSAEGAYLAAAVFFGLIYADDPARLPDLALPADTARALRKVAAETVKMSPALPVKPASTPKPGAP